MNTYRDTILTDKYWNGNGKFQEQHDKLFNELVPSSGKSETFQGEMLRAAGRLYYDYYNNANCNNTSGPVKLLIVCEDRIGCKTELEKLYAECNTGSYTNENLEVELETVMNAVISYIISMDGKYERSEVDMFEFEEPDYDEAEDDDCYAEHDEDKD